MEQDGAGWSRLYIRYIHLYVFKCEEMNQRDWAKVLSLIVKLGVDLCLGSSSVCSIGLPA